MKIKNNGIISLWKFIFSLVIVFFHCETLYNYSPDRLFKGGYIVVEFFFIVSGFYFAKSVLKEKYKKSTIGKECINFIYKKVKTFIPYIIIAYLFSLIILLLNQRLNIRTIVNSITNVLLIQEFGFNSIRILGQLWYITSMLFSMFILYPILKKHRENYILLCIPVIMVIGLGSLSHNYGHLDHAFRYWEGYWYTGITRGFIEINIGILIYYIHEKLKPIEYTTIGKIFLTFIGETLLILSLIITHFISKPQNYDFIILLFYCIALLIITSEKTYDYNILSSNKLKYLENLSLLVYINHPIFIDIATLLLRNNITNPFQGVVITILLTLLFSIIEYYFATKLKKKELIKKISNRFIKKSKISK